PPIATPEASKDQLPFMLLDSRPLIKDSHRAAVLDDDLHRRPSWRMVDCVLDQITSRSRQHLPVPMDRDGCLAAAQCDVLALCQRQRGSELRDFGADRAQIGPLCRINRERLQSAISSSWLTMRAIPSMSL